MAIIVQVKPATPCFDPFSRLRSEEGRAILEFYKEGATLHAPNGSSAHHWWMTHGDGRLARFTRHAHLGAALKLLSSPARAIPLKTRQDSAEERVGFSWQYCGDTASTLADRWLLAQQCAEDWATTAGAFNPEPRGMSMRAVATLRYLKWYNAMCLHPELLPEWLELNARGLIKVSPEGGVCLSVHKQKIPLPDGFSIYLKFVQK